MSDYWLYDFSKKGDCFAWLQLKAPYLSGHLIAVFGRTSSSKSSILNSIIGAYVVEVSDNAKTTELHLIRGVAGERFDLISHKAQRGTMLAYDDMSGEILMQKENNKERRLLPNQVLWPQIAPATFDSAGDPLRFGTLYVSYKGDRLRNAFAPSLAQNLHPLLNECRFTLFNVDSVTSDPELREKLLGVTLVDTKGLDTGQPSPFMSQVLKAATRNLYCLPAAFQDNREPALAFEKMMMEATYGSNWIHKYRDYLNIALSGVAALVSPSLVPVVSHHVSKQQQDQANDVTHVDPGFQTIWNRTMFLRGQLDRSLHRQWGYETAVQDAGMALAYFNIKPINHRVRHVACQFFAQDSEELQKRNEMEQVRNELLTPQYTSANKLCAHASAFLEVVLRNPKSTWKSNVPFFMANSDEYYVKQILEKQCRN